jgi:acyl dehydratase
MNATLGPDAIGNLIAERTFDPITREQLRRYADASGDGNPLHLDRDFAKSAGFDDVIVHGMLAMALLGRLVCDAFPTLQLLGFKSRFRNVIKVDEVIHCSARLADVADRTLTVALEASNPARTRLLEGSATLLRAAESP